MIKVWRKWEKFSGYKHYIRCFSNKTPIHWLSGNKLCISQWFHFYWSTRLCNLGLFWYIQAYMRIWWLFIECLLYDRSFMFIFPHYFSLHFFISYAFHQVGMWGSEELSLQTGVTKLLSTKCELSQGLPDSATSEKIPVASSWMALCHGTKSLV